MSVPVTARDPAGPGGPRATDSIRLFVAVHPESVTPPGLGPGGQRTFGRECSAAACLPVVAEDSIFQVTGTLRCIFIARFGVYGNAQLLNFQSLSTRLGGGSCR